MFNDGILGLIISKTEYNHEIINDCLSYIKNTDYKHIGIMIDIPKDFYINSGIINPNKDYAILNIKKSKSEPENELFLDIINEEFSSLKMHITNSRTTNSLIQLFIEKPFTMDKIEFDNYIYKTRINLEKRIKNILSFSSSYIIYKDIDLFTSDIIDYSVKSRFIMYEMSNDNLKIDSNIAFLGDISTEKSVRLDFSKRYGNIFKNDNLYSSVLDYIHYNENINYNQAILSIRPSIINHDFTNFYHRLYTLFEGPLYMGLCDYKNITIYRSNDGEYDIYKGENDNAIYILNSSLSFYNLKKITSISSYYSYNLETKKEESINNILDSAKIKNNDLTILKQEESVYVSKLEINDDLINICKNDTAQISSPSGIYPSLLKCKLDFFYTTKNKANSIYFKSVILSKAEYESVKYLVDSGYRVLEANSNTNLKKEIKNEYNIIILDDELFNEYKDIVLENSKNICFVIKTNKYDFNTISKYISLGISLVYPEKAYMNIVGYIEKNITSSDSLLTYIKYLKNNLSRLIQSYGIHNIKGFIGSNLLHDNLFNFYTKEEIMNLNQAIALNDYKKYKKLSNSLKNSFSYGEAISLNEIDFKDDLYDYFRTTLDVSESVKKCLNLAFKQDITVIDKRYNDIDFNKNELLIDFSNFKENILRTDISDYIMHKILPNLPLSGIKSHYDLYNISDLKSLVSSIKEIKPTMHIMLKLNKYDNPVEYVKYGIDELIIDDINELKRIDELLKNNNLRNNILLSFESNYKNAYDVIYASINGSNRFFFKKTILVPLGCMGLNKCSKCHYGLFGDNEFNGDINNLYKYVDMLVKEIVEVSSIIGYKGFNKKHTNLYNPNPLNKQIKSMIDSNITNINILSNNTDSIGANLYNINKELVININKDVGNQFGYYLKNNQKLILNGRALRYAGENLSGGTIIIKNPNNNLLNDEIEVLAGSSALFKASSGKLFIDGTVLDRFSMCNNGATAVVLGVGNYACSYMSNGIVVVLGEIGNNFAYNMTGGICYLYVNDKSYLDKIDLKFNDIEKLDSSDVVFLMNILEEFTKETNSKVGNSIYRFINIDSFIKVIPKNYKIISNKIKELEKEGLSRNEAIKKVL